MNIHAVMYSVFCHAIYKLGKICPTEFVGVGLQPDQPAYCCASVQCCNGLHNGRSLVV